MPISIEADPTLAQGYLKVNGVTAATVTSTGLTTASLQDNAVTTSKVNNAAITAAKVDNAAITAAKLDGAQTGLAPIYGCRAWVNFDGTRNEADTGASTNGNNVKIRASGNVASVLKNGTGDYTITFTTAMPDANYCITASTSGNLTNGSVRTIVAYGTDAGGASSKTSSSIRVVSGSSATNSLTDMAECNVSILR